MKKQPKKVFTEGISFEEHLKKAETIYNSVVKTQIDADKKQINNLVKLTLTPAQKAAANCPNPI